MNSQINQTNNAPKSVSPTENEFSENINSVSRLETIKTNKTPYTDDELIASLQNHRENRRAQQVFEWESIRRSGGAQTQQILRGIG